MNSPSPDFVTIKEALDNAFKLTSELLASLQELRINRGTMSRDEFRKKEQHLIQEIARFVEEYRKLAEQHHSESEATPC
jgi:hypothetical protein